MMLICGMGLMWDPKTLNLCYVWEQNELKNNKDKENEVKVNLFFLFLCWMRWN
jgi:hypothetical protein